MGLTDSIEFIARRYDRLAPAYGLVELIFQLPPRIRRRAVEALDLHGGDRVLEIGCGSGRNLDLLTAAVGPSGQVLGIDVSPGMLARARRLVTRRGWNNVTLTFQDAAELDPAAPLDAVLFSLSYAVIPDRHAALTRAFTALRDGGRLVIIGRVPARRPPRAPAATARLRAQQSHRPRRPAVRPWEELAALASHVETQRLHFGTYVISRALRPAN